MHGFFPFIASLLQASSITLDKVILKARGVDYRLYIGTSFPMVFACTTVLYVLFRPPIPLEIVSGTLGLMLAASVVITAIANILYYRALDRDRLGELETVNLLNNIPVVLVASLFFADERHAVVLIPALIATSAVVWGHWEHHHFRMRRETLRYILWTLATTALGASISKTLLEHVDALALELVRTGALAFVFLILYGRHIRRVSSRVTVHLFITNALTAVASLLMYMSYQRFGIVYTTLIFTLQPLLVYLSSLIVLREPLRMKRAVSFAIVLITVTVTNALWVW